MRRPRPALAEYWAGDQFTGAVGAVYSEIGDMMEPAAALGVEIAEPVERATIQKLSSRRRGARDLALGTHAQLRLAAACARCCGSARDPAFEETDVYHRARLSMRPRLK